MGITVVILRTVHGARHTMGELLRTHLDPDPASVVVARHAVRSELRKAGLDALADVATLLTSEVVTNAVRHAATPFAVQLDWNGQRVRVDVRDESPEPLRPRRPASPEPGGHGLRIIDALASRWGFEREHGDGKAVWFELDLA